MDSDERVSDHVPGRVEAARARRARMGLRDARHRRAVAAADEADDAARDLAARLDDAVGVAADVLRDVHGDTLGRGARVGARDYVTDLLGDPAVDIVRRAYLDTRSGGPLAPGSDAWRREREGWWTGDGSAVGGHAVTTDRWSWPRRLADDPRPDRADPDPERHAADCAALVAADSSGLPFACDYGCPDGLRWNTERARRLDEADPRKFGRRPTE